jgi:hypothetical protein
VSCSAKAAAASAAVVTPLRLPASPAIAVLACAVATSYVRFSAAVASSPARTAWVATALPAPGSATAILAAASSAFGSCTICASIT